MGERFAYAHMKTEQALTTSELHAVHNSFFAQKKNFLQAIGFAYLPT